MRVAITSWFGGRKCKLWIRANLLSEIREPGIVRRFFDEIKSECVNLREFCVSYFSNLTESLQLASTGLSLKKSYGIFIQMVSSGNAQLRKAIRKNLAAFGDDDRSEVEAKLLNVFHDEFGIGLPKREEASRYVKCYDYPLIDMRLINERIASRLRAADGAREQFDDTGSGTDEIISAAVFDAYDEFLDVWGIVYEDVPLRKHGITGPMVVSGELTLQLGSLY